MINIENRDKIRKIWQQIPLDTDILITQGSPFQTLDKTISQIQTGYEDLLDRTK